MIKRLLNALALLLLPVAFAAIMCAGPGSMLFSAIYNDFFRITEKYVCPQTGKAIIKTYHTSPGSTSWSMYCLDLEDQIGKDDQVGWAILILFLGYFGAFYAVALVWAVWLARPTPAPTSERLPQLRNAGALVDSQVRDLLARNQKLEAIKIVRQATNMSLAEAKDYVERLGRVQVLRVVGEGVTATAGAGSEGRVSKLRELKQLLDEGLITASEYESKKQKILDEF